MNFNGQTYRTVFRPLRFISIYAKEVLISLSVLLSICGIVMIFFGGYLCFIGDKTFDKYLILVFGGFALFRALIELSKILRDEQATYGYDMIMDWHNTIATINKESELFKVSIEEYDALDGFKKKVLGDDFQRVIDFMNIILWSQKKDYTSDSDCCREAWINTFKQSLINSKGLTKHLWLNIGYRDSISTEYVKEMDEIFIHESSE